MSIYRVVAGPVFPAWHLARAPRFDRVESAVGAMAEGVVLAVGADGATRLVAFHERHLAMVVRLSAASG